MASNTGWSGSKPQVVLAADVNWGGGSSGGGGADDSGGSSYNDKPLWDALKSLQSQISDLYAICASFSSSIQSLMSSVSSLASVDAAQGQLISSLKSLVSALQDTVGKVQADIASLARVDASQGDLLSSLLSRTGALADVDTAQGKLISANKVLIAGVQSKIVDLVGVDASQGQQIHVLSTRDDSLQAQLDVLSSSLSALDTVAVVHSVDVVRDTLVSKFDWLFKMLSDINHLIADVDTLLSDLLQKILDKLISLDNQLGGFVALFKSFRDDFTGSILNIRQDIANFEKGVFSGLIAVSEWLKAIYYSILSLPAPETSEIHLPTTDDGGGGSGTNIWDVLKQLIESLGTIVGKLVDALSKFADLVSQLFVPKDLSFITDTFDGISSKFDKKFAIFIDFGSSLKGLFSSRHALKDFSLSFAGASVVVPLSMVSTLAGQMRPLLTGLFVLLTVTGVYRRFTDGEVVS